MRLPAGLSPLRHRDFALYWVGQCVSQVGTFIEMTATTYLLYAITSSPVLLGLGGVTRAVPLLAFTLFGGALADRIDRRRLLMFTQGSQVLTSLVLGTLVVTGTIQFWHIYVVGVLNSTLSAFDAPSRNSFFPSLIPRADFQSAVSLNSMIVRLSTLLGPAIAGVLIATVGAASPFFVNAASYFAMIGALLLIRARVGATPGRRTSLRSAIGGGLRFAMRSPVLPLILGTEAVLSLFGHNSALITIFARDVLDAGPQGLGLLLSSIGAGAIVGTFVLVGTGELRRKGAVMIVAGLLYAAALFVFSISTSFAMSIAVLFVLGFADSFWGAMRNTIIQLEATDAFRGRITSLVTFTSRGLTNAGQIETGGIIAAVGPALGGAINGIVIGAAVLLIAVRSQRLRDFTSSAQTEIAEPAAPQQG